MMYKAIFKCRLCGAEYANDVDDKMAHHMILSFCKSEAQPYGIHDCADDESKGIADFKGWKKCDS